MTEQKTPVVMSVDRASEDGDWSAEIDFTVNSDGTKTIVAFRRYKKTIDLKATGK